MGKGILIFVMASSLSLSAMYLAGTESDIDSAQTEAEYKEEILARETATSAYNMVVSRVKRDFDGYRGSYNDLEYGKATYDMSAAAAEDGSVTVVAVGKYGGKEYQITGRVTRGGSVPLDAVTLLSAITDVGLEDNYQIRGGSQAHAIRTIWSAARQAFSQAAVPAQVTGIGGQNDIVHEELQISIPSLRAKIENYSGDNLVAVSIDREGDLSKWLKDKAKKGQQNLTGFPGSPVVMIIDDDVEIGKDVAGHGILFVEGDIVMEKNASWTGLVYMVGEDSNFEMSDDASITGALIIDTSAIPKKDDKKDDGSEDRGLLGGHFDVDVFEEPGSDREIYHQHAYDDKFATTQLDVLSSGCKNGGLCWAQTVGTSGVSQVELISANTHKVDGTYEIKVGSTVYSGNLGTPFSIVANPSQISKILFKFNTLCALIPSSPSDVQVRPDGRNEAFTLRVMDTSASQYQSGQAWNNHSNSGLVYEVNVYHHAKKTDPCGAGGGVDDVWANPKGDTYSGDDPTCVSEDSNDDLYTDAAQRSKKWGTRKYQKGTKGKKSEKFWLPSGECGLTDKEKDMKKKDKTGSFTMEDEASIMFDMNVLRGLKSMLTELDVVSGAPTARKLNAEARDRDMIRKLDGSMVQKSSVQ